MTLFRPDHWIPVAAALVGAMATYFVVESTRQSDPDRQVAMERFEELPAIEQDNVRNIAAVYRDFDQQDKDRLKAIHRAVEQDPALLAQMESLKNLLDDLDPESRARVESSRRSSPEQWLSVVRELHERQERQKEQIAIRLPSWPPDRQRDRDWLHVTPQQFDRFLDSALPASLPPEVDQRLQRFGQASQSGERTLTKICWLMNQLMSPQQSSADIRRILEAARKQFASADDQDRLNDLLDPGPPPPRSNDRNGDDTGGRYANFFERLKAMTLLREPLRHFERQFNDRHSDVNHAPDIFEEAPLKTQSALMKMDPADAVEMLNGLTITQSSEADPVVSLSEDLNRLKERFHNAMRGGRGGFGGRGPGGDPRGPGDSRREEQRGGGPRNGGRPRDGDGGFREGRPPSDRERPRTDEDRPMPRDPGPPDRNRSRS